MTHQQNLDAVRSAALNSVYGDVYDGSCVCGVAKQCAFHAKTERFDPTILEVLPILGGIESRCFAVIASATGISPVVTWAADETIANRETAFAWDTHYPLSGQSNEDVASLAALLKHDA